MKQTFAILSFLMISQLCIAQRIYVWCPDEQVIKPRVGFLDSQVIDLVILDNRILAETAKQKCEGSAVLTSLTSNLTKAYPSAKINILSSQEFYKNAEKGRIRLKIEISNYYVSFDEDLTIGGSLAFLKNRQKWNGYVAYNVQIIDYRETEKKKFEEKISETSQAANDLGVYKTARKVLNNTYAKANQKLFTFIEHTFSE
jgi:hypothetical protein